MAHDITKARDLAKLTAEERKFFLDALGPEYRLEYEASWHHWARDEQLAPAGDWTVWMIMAGAVLARPAPVRNGSAILPKPTAARALLWSARILRRRGW